MDHTCKSYSTNHQYVRKKIFEWEDADIDHSKFAAENCSQSAYIQGDCSQTQINQSNLCSANISGEARLSGATAESVVKIEETVL